MSSYSKTPLFLMEIVIMLLVFAISGSISLKVFVEGKNISKESYNLDKACREAEKAAEYWQYTKGDIEETAKLLHAQKNGSEMEVIYDEHWEISDEVEVFTLSMETDDTTVEITINHLDKEIFNITTEAVIFGE